MRWTDAAQICKLERGLDNPYFVAKGALLEDRAKPLARSDIFETIEVLELNDPFVCQVDHTGSC